MRKRHFTFLLILTFVSLSSYILLRNNNITFYMGIANPSEEMDLFVKVDNRILFNDTLTYHPYKYKIKEERFKAGVYKLLVQSKKEGLLQEKNILILFNQHIVVEFYPKTDDLDGKQIFLIRNRLSPFYFE